MTSNLLLPDIVKKSFNAEKLKDSSIEIPDFDAVSKGIIEGGADFIFNRFNVGVPITPGEARASIINSLVSSGAFFYQLDTLQMNFEKKKGEAERFGVYFELPSKGHKQIENKSSPQQDSHGTDSAVRDLAIREEDVDFKKVPEQYTILNTPKYDRAMLVWNAKERLRRQLAPEPICKGVLIINEYIYKDERNMRGNSVLEYAIASKSEQGEVFEKISMLNGFVNNFKVFDTSFLVGNKKAISQNMKPEDIASLRGKSMGLSYKFKLAGTSPVDALAPLAKQFGYKAVGFAWVEDPVFRGCLTNGSQEFNLDDLPRQIPNMGGIQLVGEDKSRITLDAEKFHKNSYSFTVSDLECNVGAEFASAFTNEIGRLGATTCRKVSYKNLFLDNNSIYLPGFPMACKNTISIGYPGDLSALRK